MQALNWLSRQNAAALTLVFWGVLLPVAGSLVSALAMPAWRFEGLVPHLFLEAGGSLTAVAILLFLQLAKTDTALSKPETRCLVAALASMAIFDLFHVAVAPGNLFVFFHSIAVFVGGVLFAVVCIRDRFQLTVVPRLSTCIWVSSAAGFVFYIWPDLAPTMLDVDGFSVFARALNLIGGFGFLCSAFHFWHRFRKTEERGYFLLAAHCLLFGCAGVLFESSSLWDAAWWWWHLLRFAAYVVLAAFFLQAFSRFIHARDDESFAPIDPEPLSDLTRNDFQFIAELCAFAVIAIALMVIFGWMAEYRPLIQIHQSFAPMQFNTALGFLFAGGGLMALITEKEKPAKLLGWGAILLGGLTILEYLFGTNLGIDELFVDGFVTTKTSHPGRMAPNTATGFFLSGLLLVLAPAKLRQDKVAIVEFLGLVIFALAAVVAVGYAQSSERAATWADMTRMAVHTATGFALLGIGYTSLAWKWQKTQIATVPVWVPFVLCVAVLILDLKVPLGVAIGICYAPLVFCSLWFRQLHTPFMFAGISSLLILLGYYASPLGPGDPNAVIANRALSVVAVWIIASIVFIQSLTQRRLIENRQRLNDIFGHMSEALLTFGRDGKIQAANPAARRYFAIAKDDKLSHLITDFVPLSADAAGTISIDPADWQKLEIDAQTLDGRTFPARISISEVPIGKEILYSAFIEDITDEHQARARIARSIEDLQKSNKALDDFAYIASHDLKEPLRGMSNHAQFLLEDYGDTLGEDGTKRLQRMIALGGRQESLIKNLLYYARLGRVEESYRSVGAHQVVEDVKERLKEYLAEKNVKVTVDENIPTIWCDATKITELFYNLILNGVKYNESDEKHIHVGFLTSTTHDGKVYKDTLYVKDNGIGIPAEFHDQVFRIFKRLHNEKKYGEGTGAGLTFVKKIIDMHNGDIWIQSSEGEGTTIYFTLGGN